MRKHRTAALQKLQNPSPEETPPDLTEQYLRLMELDGAVKTPEEWVEFYNLSLQLRTMPPSELLLSCFRKAMS